MYKHTLSETDGDHALLRDGKPMICPFKPDQIITKIVPSKIVGGQPEAVTNRMTHQCGSWCPHFRHGADDEDYPNPGYVMLTCSAREVLISIKE